MKSLDAAAKILREANEPLHIEEITRRILSRGLWQTQGATPEYTINTNILNDIKSKGDSSIFEHVSGRTYRIKISDTNLSERPITTIPDEKDSHRPDIQNECLNVRSDMQLSEKISNCIADVLLDMNRLEAKLNHLSDEIWLSIDHNNQNSLKSGVEMKVYFNRKLSDFRSLYEDIRSISYVDRKNNIDRDSPKTSVRKRTSKSKSKNAGMMMLSHNKPRGFTLNNRSYSVSSWREMYLKTIELLYHHDERAFKELINSNNFISERGLRDFSDKPEHLRMPIKVAGGIYAETNFSANTIVRRIHKLLHFFKIDVSSFTIQI